MAYCLRPIQTGQAGCITARGRKMSRKSIGILLGIYFLSALAFTVFRAFSNPFFARLDAPILGKAIGGALLLYAGAGLLLSRNLMLSGSKLSCLDSQHASKFRTEIGITEREISLYCGCVSEALAASTTSDELTYIATNGQAPQAVQERAAEMGRPCRALIGRTKKM